MKFEWEEIYEDPYTTTRRAKVIGGWVIINSSKNGVATIFVPDKDHKWSINGIDLDVMIEEFEIKDVEPKINYYLSRRTINCLKSEKINTIGDLLSWCTHQLLSIPNLGCKSLDDIEELLSQFNLSLNSKPHKIIGNWFSKCYACIEKENSNN